MKNRSACDPDFTPGFATWILHPDLRPGFCDEWPRERCLIIRTKDGEEERRRGQVCVAQLQCGSLWAKRRSGFTHPPPIQYDTGKSTWRIDLTPDFRLIFFEAGRPEFAKNPGKTANTELKIELENRPGFRTGFYT